MCVVSVASGCMKMATLKQRMPEWVNRVPYSHSVNKTWGYPTDCSGFVSWALNVGQDLKAYEYGALKYSTRIQIDDLQYGDIITHVYDPLPFQHRCVKTDEFDEPQTISNISLTGNPLDYLWGHVMFFDKWADKSHKTFWAYESTSTDCSTPLCLNHHVIKKRKKIEKWSAENCTSSQYGFVEGGVSKNKSIIILLQVNVSLQLYSLILVH
eukprot:g9711.t1